MLKEMRKRRNKKQRYFFKKSNMVLKIKSV